MSDEVMIVGLFQARLWLLIYVRQGYDRRSISDKVIIFCLFQADCEARGAVLVEPTSNAELDAVYALLNIGK